MDIAQLGFRVNTDGLDRGVRRMDALNASGRRVGDTGGLIDRSMRSAGEGMGVAAGAGRGLVTTLGGIAATAASGLGIAELVSASTQFESVMNGVQEKLNVTGDEMEAVRQAALDLGVSTAFSADEVGEAFGALAEANIKLVDIIKVTPDVLDFATAAQIRLEDSARIVTDTMGQFGLATTESTRIVNALAGASDTSQSNVEQFASALSKVGPTAQSMNLPLESTIGMLAAMAQNGIRAEVAGTSLSAMITRLTVAAGDGAKALGEIGLSSADFIKIADDGSEGMIEYADAIDLIKNSGASTTQVMRIFGAEAGKGVVGAVNLGGEAVRQFTSNLQDAASAAQQAKTQAQGLPGAITAIGSAWKGVQLAIMGTGGNTIVITVLENITEALKFFATTGVDYIETAVEKLQRQFQVLKFAIKFDDSSLYTFLRETANTIQDMTQYIKPLIPYLAEFRVKFAAIAATAVGLGVVAGALSAIAAVVLSPVVLGIAAIAASAILIRENWNGIVAWWDNLWGRISTAVNTTLPNLSENFNGVLADFKGLFSELEKTAQVFKQDFLIIWANLSPGLTTVFKSAWDIVGVVTEIAFTNLKNIVAAGWSVVVGFLTGAMEIMRGDFAKGWMTISQTIYDFGADMVSAFGDVYPLMQIAGLKIVIAIKDGLLNGARIASDAIMVIGRSIVDGIGNIVSSVTDAALDIGTGFVDGITSKVGDVGRAALEMAGIVEPTVRDAVESNSPSKMMMRIGFDVVEGFAIGIISAGERVRSAVEGVTDKAVAAFDRMVEGLSLQYIKFTEGEEAARRYELRLIGITGTAADFIVEQEQINDALEEQVRVADRVAGELGDLSNAQELQNIELTQGAAAADKARLMMDGYTEAQAESAVQTQKNMEFQKEFHTALKDSIANASSIKDAFQNMGEWMKQWLKDKIAEFAANKIMVFLGMGDEGFSGGLSSILGNAGGILQGFGSKVGGFLSTAGTAVQTFGGTLNNGFGGILASVGGAVSNFGSSITGMFASTAASTAATVGSLDAAAASATSSAAATSTGFAAVASAAASAAAIAYTLGKALGDLTGAANSTAVGIGAALGAALGSIVPVIGTWIGGTLGSAIGSAFGGSWQHIANGFELAFQEGDLQGMSFQYFEKERSLWRGTATRIIEEELDSDIENSVRNYFTKLTDSIVVNAESLGVVGADQLFDSFTVATQRFQGDTAQQQFEIWMQGVTLDAYETLYNGLGPKLTEALRTVALEVGDEIKTLEQIFSEINNFDSLEEAAEVLGLEIEAVGTLFTELSQVAAVLVPILSDAGAQFGQTLDEQIASLYSLSEAMGGVDVAIERTTFFYDNFVPAAEKTNLVLQQATESVATWNESMGRGTTALITSQGAIDILTGSFDTSTTAGNLATIGINAFTGAVDESTGRININREGLANWISALEENEDISLAATEAGRMLNAAIAQYDAAVFTSQGSLLGYTSTLDLNTAAGQRAMEQVTAFTSGIDTATGSIQVNQAGLLTYIESLDLSTAAGRDAHDSATALAEVLGITGDTVITTRDQFYEYINSLDLTTEAGQQSAATAFAQMEAIIALDNAQQQIKLTLDTVTQAASLLNLNFDATSPLAISASESLVQLMGGLDSFVSATNSYYENYYSLEERQRLELAQSAAAVQVFNDQLTANGGVALTTADQFRRHVESLDLQTASGQLAFAQAMAVSDSFLAVVNSGQSMEDIINALPEELQGTFNLMVQDATNAANALDEQARNIYTSTNSTSNSLSLMDIAFIESAGVLQTQANGIEGSTYQLGNSLYTIQTAADGTATIIRNSAGTISTATQNAGGRLANFGNQINDVAGVASGALGRINQTVKRANQAYYALEEERDRYREGAGFATGLTRVAQTERPVVVHYDELIMRADIANQYRAMGGTATSLPPMDNKPNINIMSPMRTGSDNSGDILSELRANREEIAALRREQASQAQRADVSREFIANGTVRQTQVLQEVERGNERLSRKITQAVS